MLVIVLGVVATVLLALVVYQRRERLGAAGLGMAALRTVAFTALLVLLVNPVRMVRERSEPPTVLLDASLSMGASGGAWHRAADTAAAIAGSRGTIMRFGLVPMRTESGPPEAGASRVVPALAAARGGGPVFVVSDGELDDWASVPPTQLAGVTLVIVPRDTVADAALLDVALPAAQQETDSMPIAMTVGTWGPLAADSGRVVIASEGRTLLERPIALPPAPGTARRRVVLPPGVLGAGLHVVDVTLNVPGDREPRTNVRRRIVRVAQRPSVVVLVDPADWEGRFLVRTLHQIVPSGVTAFARIAPERWVTMDRLQPASAATRRAALSAAQVVVVRGGAALVPAGVTPVWWWPRGAAGVQPVAGDWYVTASVPNSPLADRLGLPQWENLAPLSALIPVTVTGESWAALMARRGRRGSPQPVLVGRDSAGTRRLTMAGSGAWRWALRGGEALEAYRSLVAAGIDWLLASRAVGRAQPLVAGRVRQRGLPLDFQWRGGPVPDSLVVLFTGRDSSFSRTLRFDSDGLALVSLPPGVYSWRAPAADVGAVAVIEDYSDEFHPRPVVPARGAIAPMVAQREVAARRRWWLFAVVIVALVGEWAWRQRKGLA